MNGLFQCSGGGTRRRSSAAAAAVNRVEKDVVTGFLVTEELDLGGDRIGNVLLSGKDPKGGHTLNHQGQSTILLVVYDIGNLHQCPNHRRLVLLVLEGGILLLVGVLVVGESIVGISQVF